MVRMRRNRRLFKGQLLNLGMLVNYKRDLNLSLNEYVDHVVMIIKEFEMKYVFTNSKKKKDFLQLSLTHPHANVLEQYI